MTFSSKLRIRTKIIILIIPLLICGFAMNGYISVLLTRDNLLNQSSQFISYKMRLFETYAFNQWRNLEESGLSEDPDYTQIIEESLKHYADGMVLNDSEQIIAVDSMGELKFSTGDLGYSLSDYTNLKNPGYIQRAGVYKYKISDTHYYGLYITLNYPQWTIYILEDDSFFQDLITEIIIQQGLSILIVLLVIVIAIIMLMKTITEPIKRFRNTIHEIIEYRDFTRKVDIEYPDEIGDLAFDFNTMIWNINLTYTKLKEYAYNEVINHKKLLLREYETLDVLARASDYKDPETAAHIARVSNYSLLLAKLLGLDQETQDLILYSTPLHDIGKLGIPDSILLKPGRLDDEEADFMKKHTIMGYEIMHNPSSKYLKAGAIITLSHHEKYDGTGYPNALIGEEIPLLGRIVSLADVLDALTTERPYKKAWTFEESAEQIIKDRGTHFDPVLVDIFKNNLSKFKSIYLKNGL